MQGLEVNINFAWEEFGGRRRLRYSRMEGFSLGNCRELGLRTKEVASLSHTQDMGGFYKT